MISEKSNVCMLQNSFFATHFFTETDQISFVILHQSAAFLFFAKMHTCAKMYIVLGKNNHYNNFV